MSYVLYFEKQVIKFLSNLDKNTNKIIFRKIEILKTKPVPHDAKRLINVKDKVFRIRIGDYRILYRIENNKLIIIFLIDKRSRVYKNRK